MSERRKISVVDVVATKTGGEKKKKKKKEEEKSKYWSLDKILNLSELQYSGNSQDF